MLTLYQRGDQIGVFLQPQRFNNRQPKQRAGCPAHCFLCAQLIDLLYAANIRTYLSTCTGMILWRA